MMSDLPNPRRRALKVRDAVIRAAGICVATAASASAANPIKLPGTDKGILQWVIALGLILVICLPAGMNAKRSHQD